MVWHWHLHRHMRLSLQIKLALIMFLLMSFPRPLQAMLSAFARPTRQRCRFQVD